MATPKKDELLHEIHDIIFYPSRKIAEVKIKDGNGTERIATDYYHTRVLSAIPTIFHALDLRPDLDKMIVLSKREVLRFLVEHCEESAAAAKAMYEPVESDQSVERLRQSVKEAVAEIERNAEIERKNRSEKQSPTFREAPAE